MTTVVYPQFKRVWRVRFSQGSSAREFTDPLKCQWEMTHGLNFDPSTFSLSLFGLNAEQRAFCMRKGTIVELFAGYEAIGAGLFYRGAVWWGQPTVDGADWGIRIQSFGSANRHAVVKVSKGMAHSEVLTAILEAYSTSTGIPIVKGTLKPPSGTIARAQTFTGPVEGILRQYAKEHGLDVGVVNGVVNAVPRGTDTGEGLIVVSPETGLEGAPELVQPGYGAQSFQPRGIRFSMRLRADVHIGRRIQVVSPLIPGGRQTFTVARVSCKGDSRDQAWSLGIEGY